MINKIYRKIAHRFANQKCPHYGNNTITIKQKSDMANKGKKINCEYCDAELGVETYYIIFEYVFTILIIMIDAMLHFNLIAFYLITIIYSIFIKYNIRLFNSRIYVNKIPNSNPSDKRCVNTSKNNTKIAIILFVLYIVLPVILYKFNQLVFSLGIIYIGGIILIDVYDYILRKFPQLAD